MIDPLPAALTVAALRDILSQAEDTAVVWLDCGHGFRVAIDDWRIVSGDPEYEADLVIDTRSESWEDVASERVKAS